MRAVRRRDIYHRYFTTTVPPKYKFFVIVGEDEEHYFGYFFINSNINAFVRRDEAKYDMQMALKPEDYPFLDHLSFVAAHELSMLRKETLIRELSEGKTQIKGRLKEEDWIALRDAVLHSPLFSAREKAFLQ